MWVAIYMYIHKAQETRDWDHVAYHWCIKCYNYAMRRWYTCRCYYSIKTCLVIPLLSLCNLYTSIYSLSKYYLSSDKRIHTYSVHWNAHSINFRAKKLWTIDSAWLKFRALWIYMYTLFQVLYSYSEWQFGNTRHASPLRTVFFTSFCDC